MNALRLFCCAAVALLVCHAASAVAPLVDLDARAAVTGAPWMNPGSLGGSFAPLGHPTVATVAGARAVTLDGIGDGFRGPNSSAAMDGGAPRTIAVWVYAPKIDRDEETIVSWGKRGGPDGTLMAFGWGRNGSYGAMAHWAADMGWNAVPRPGKWRFLVYTYDGRVARVFDDTVEKANRGAALHTAAGLPILIGAQNGPDGATLFRNEFTGESLSGALSVGSLQILPGALTAAEIGAAFDRDAARYGASRADAAGFAGAGSDRFTAGPFTLSLLRATQTAALLSPDGGKFDFTPGDRVASRASEGYYHLGDMTLRARFAGEAAYQSYSSAARVGDIVPLRDAKALAACDLTPNLGPGCPLKVERAWVNDRGTLAMRFTLTNPGAKAVEIGSFGAAMVFNNLITGRNLDDTHDTCSFSTPSIGEDAGYLQVTRLNGHGPALLVLPEKGTGFEAYRPLYDDPTPRYVTFEGFYEWMTHSAAYAEKEWKRAAGHWNPPTSATLKPGQAVTYGYRFALAPTIEGIEPALIAERRPVAVGVPGYVVATDTPARLFLHYPAEVRSITCEPAAALHIKADRGFTAHGWARYTLSGLTPGRSRVVIAYADGTVQAIPYFVIPPEAEQVRRLGMFHATRQWFTDPNDPFHRTDSWLAFNRETDALVMQHSHSWFAGLSDEIGAGPSVAMAMKNLGQPDPREVAQLEDYANHALYGNLQNKDYSVRASLFYYEPKLLPPGYYTVRGGWDKARSETTWRTFNYPHVTAVYYALYHLARDYSGLTKQQKWDWYLDHAYNTAMAMPKFAAGYEQFGLMVGSVFPSVIRDLRREGWTEKADILEAHMHGREQRWKTLRYPFGSEMPWDSTGQEEIYTWCRYFGDDDKAQVTLDAITGYMPTVPNWAYNGAARRYFDAPVNGNAWTEIVQVTNHYGAAINAIPVLDDYKRNPADLYLLRVGYAGMDQILANIDPRGFASYGFDTDPAHLDFDPYTADYGIAFFGYARNAGAYVIEDPEFGLLAFGGIAMAGKDGFEVEPRDAFRKRVYLAPLGLQITLDAGQIERVTCNPHTRQVTVTLAPATAAAPVALLRLERPGQATTGFAPGGKLSLERGAWAVPLGAKATTVTLHE
jgi:hypothetical protein